MMPVIRISDATWNRLKEHARPLEDSVDDVVNLALDALDTSCGRASSVPRKKPSPARVNTGPKLPQKEFRRPLLKTLAELGGSARVRDIRKAIEPKVTPKLHKADFDLVSTGEPRWWNAICWERADLVREGLLKNDSARGEWELSEEGRKYLSLE